MDSRREFAAEYRIRSRPPSVGQEPSQIWSSSCRKVQVLLGQYKQARNAAALVEGVLELLTTANAMHLLPGFQAFVPPQDRHLLQVHCSSS